ncbi:MAG: hypothetical protein AB7O38_00215 [Pirellulaceae bacterium]
MRTRTQEATNVSGRTTDSRAGWHRGSHALRIMVGWGMLVMAAGIAAQQPQIKPEPAAPAKGSKGRLEDLAVSQAQLADKYARLEQLLIRMSEMEAATNPQRASLLKRAAQQSTDRMTRQQLQTLVKLLTPPSQLKRAVDEQQHVITDLEKLLELLQSEDRADRLKSERERIQEYVRQLERLLRQQADVQGRTEGGGDAAQLAEDQAEVADRTDELAEQIRKNEEGGAPQGKQDSPRKDTDPPGGQESDKKSNQSPDGKSAAGDKSAAGKKGSAGKKGAGQKRDTSGDKSQPEGTSGKAGDQESDGKQPGEKQAQGKPSSDSANKEKSELGQPSSDSTPQGKSDPKEGGKGKAGKSGKSTPGKPTPGKSGEEREDSESSDAAESPAGQQDANQHPARKRLEAAEERMREAQRKLAQAKRKDAITEQEQAREELERAKAELERILRQLREEEIERTLALLEGRFRRMLLGQIQIYESTKRLDQVPGAQRTRDMDVQAGKLGFEEGKLAVEADKALLVLREEGSSVAFPETVEMMRDDMQQVAERLAQSRVDSLTQSIEEEIIRSLEELIAALQKAQQDLKDKRQPPQQGEPMDPADRPLVDRLAELKMIRSLQMRVNARTLRYARLLDNIEDPVGRANDADLRQSISKLAELEQRVFEITRNIVLGKNE